MRKAARGPPGQGARGKGRGPQKANKGERRDHRKRHIHTPRQTGGCVQSGRVKGDRQKRQKKTDGGGELVREAERDRKR